MLRCLIASLAIALWAGSCSLLVVMPRQLSSAQLASGTVHLTPTVITCIVSTTFHPLPYAGLGLATRHLV
eukprot:9407143-Pyramimonas_sp.AAC.1